MFVGDWCDEWCEWWVGGAGFIEMGWWGKLSARRRL